MVVASKVREVGSGASLTQRRMSAKNRKHCAPGLDQSRTLVLPLPRCDRQVPLKVINEFKSQIEFLFRSRFEDAPLSKEGVQRILENFKFVFDQDLSGKALVCDRVNKELTKVAQETVGVSGLDKFIKLATSEHNLSFSKIARSACEAGLFEMESRLWTESRHAVLNDFRRSAQEICGEGDSRQWSLRLDRPIFLRLIALAQELALSRSELAKICIAKGIAANFP